MSTEAIIEQSFDYTDLNQIDPSQQSLPTDMYTLKILKAELTSGNSKSSGKPYQCVSMTMSVTDHPDCSGRRLWERFFPGDFGLKSMRRIMDATGIVQVPGTPITEWLKELSVTQPTFKVQVQQVEDRDYKTGDPRSYDFKGDVAKVNKISWFNVIPA